MFQKLLAIYGDRFLSMWSQSPSDEMKSVWADALGGFSGESIASALKACYEEPHCPNLPTFIAICRRRSPSFVVPADVDAPIPKDQAVKIIAEAQKRAGIRVAEKYDFKQWAKDIIRDYEAGTYKYEHGYITAKNALQ